MFFFISRRAFTIVYVRAPKGRRRRHALHFTALHHRKVSAMNAMAVEPYVFGVVGHKCLPPKRHGMCKSIPTYHVCRVGAVENSTLIVTALIIHLCMKSVSNFLSISNVVVFCYFVFEFGLVGCFALFCLFNVNIYFIICICISTEIHKICHDEIDDDERRGEKGIRS